MVTWEADAVESQPHLWPCGLQDLGGTLEDEPLASLLGCLDVVSLIRIAEGLS